MNAFLASCLLTLAVSGVVGGTPVPVQPVPKPPSYPMKLTATSRTLQSVSHMAVVDVMAPLSTAIWTLETKWFDLLKVASDKKIDIPSFEKPKVEIHEVYTCEPKSYPKYSAALKFLMDNEKMIEEHTKNAKLIASGLSFVTELIVDKKITDKILSATTTRLSEYLVHYSKMLNGVKAAVCAEVRMVMEESKPKYENESPLSIFGVNIMEDSTDPEYQGRDTDSGDSLIDRDSHSAHLIDSDSEHLIGEGDTDSAHLIRKRFDTDDAVNMIGL